MREQAGRQQLRWRQRRRRCPMKMCRGRLKVDKDGRRGEDGGGRGDERAGCVNGVDPGCGDSDPCL